MALMALVLLGYLGRWHPMGDAFAVFRVPLAIMLLGLAVLLRPGWWLRGLAMVTAVIPLVGTALLMLPEEEGATPFSVYQKNLLYLHHDRTPLIEDILEADPDFVVLQEVSVFNRSVLAALREVAPTQLSCSAHPVGRVAVLSRFPKVPGSDVCFERGGLTAMQVETGQGRVWIVGVHLHWPWPHGQAVHVDQMLPTLKALQGPKIISGDFNTVAWAHTITRIEEATGTQRVGPLRASFTLPVLPMRVGIDHTLAHPTLPGRVVRRPAFASDHNGFLAHVHPSD